MSEINNEGRPLEWDDEITKSSQEFVLLEEGDYPFTIDHYERSRSQGTGKLPACNMAIVFFNVFRADGSCVQLRDRFLLHTALEWKLSSLFESVGLKQKGEPLSMVWNQLPGLSGRCHVKQTPGQKDPSRLYNEIDRLYAKEGPARTFTPGKF